MSQYYDPFLQSLMFGGSPQNFYGTPGSTFTVPSYGYTNPGPQQPTNSGNGMPEYVPSNAPPGSPPAGTPLSGSGYDGPTPVYTPGNSGTVSAPSAPPLTGAGFSFAAPPLVLSGETIPGSLGFDLPLAAANVDQGAQAYAFLGSSIANDFGFLQQADTQAFQSSGPGGGSIGLPGGGPAGPAGNLSFALQQLGVGLHAGGGGPFGGL